MGALDYLTDRSDERVQAALQRPCTICHQPPGVDCRHPWETREELGRVVHLSRVQADMDKRPRRKKAR